MSEIRTFPIVTPARSTPITVSIANLYTHFALVLPNEPKSEDESDDPLETSPIITILSTLSSDDPFPRPNPENGNPRFCMKTYTENEGVLEQLVDFGIARPVAQLSNGPLVEVLLDDREISHACLNCIEKKGVLGAKFELLGKERLMRCSGCKKVFYCNTEVGYFVSFTRKYSPARDIRSVNDKTGAIIRKRVKYGR